MMEEFQIKVLPGTSIATITEAVKQVVGDEFHPLCIALISRCMYQGDWWCPTFWDVVVDPRETAMKDIATITVIPACMDLSSTDETQRQKGGERIAELLEDGAR